MKTSTTVLLAATAALVGVGIAGQAGSLGAGRAEKGAAAPPARTQTKSSERKYNPVSESRRAEVNRAWSSAREALIEAQASFDKGDYRTAEQLARQSIALAPMIDGVQQAPMGASYLLTGDVRMELGDYAGALSQYKVAEGSTWRPAQGLNVAICYARLGRLAEARKLYSERQILQYNGIAKADLPGTDTATSLEASLLLARGLDRYFAGRFSQALKDFEATKPLARNNPVAAYYSGMALSFLNRGKEAALEFQTAAKNGRGDLAKDAVARSRG
jgi:tetratricopeptide (TPR) repeat protein